MLSGRRQTMASRMNLRSRKKQVGIETKGKGDVLLECSGCEQWVGADNLGENGGESRGTQFICKSCLKGERLERVTKQLTREVKEWRGKAMVWKRKAEEAARGERANEENERKIRELEEWKEGAERRWEKMEEALKKVGVAMDEEGKGVRGRSFDGGLTDSAGSKQGQGGLEMTLRELDRSEVVRQGEGGITVKVEEGVNTASVVEVQRQDEEESRGGDRHGLERGDNWECIGKSEPTAETETDVLLQLCGIANTDGPLEGSQSQCEDKHREDDSIPVVEVSTRKRKRGREVTGPEGEEAYVSPKELNSGERGGVRGLPTGGYWVGRERRDDVRGRGCQLANTSMGMNVKKILIIGDMTINGIEHELGEFLGNGIHIKVVALPGAKVETIRQNLDYHMRQASGRNQRIDAVVIHVGGNHIQSVSGEINIEEFLSSVVALINGTEAMYGKGVGAWSGIVPRVDAGEAGLWSCKVANDELARIMVRRGWGFMSHWREFMEGGRVRHGLLWNGVDCSYGEGRVALIRGLGRGILQWVYTLRG